jgi:hypothetical protein
MDIILFNVARIIGLLMFTLSGIAIIMSLFILGKMGDEDGRINSEDIKEYETLRLYGIIIPSLAAIVSLIILAPIILIELYTNM